MVSEYYSELLSKCWRYYPFAPFVKLNNVFSSGPAANMAAI